MKPVLSPRYENIPLAGASSFTRRGFRQKTFDFPWHQHPEAELTWIVRGTGLRYVGDSVEPFGPGDFCLIGANLPHTWLSGSASRKGVHSEVLQFDPAHFGTEFHALPELARIHSLLELAARGICFQHNKPEKLFRKIDRATSPICRLAAVLEVLDALAGSPARRVLCLSSWGNSSRRRPAGDRLSRLMCSLAANSDLYPTHQEAARLAGLTPAAFSRFFRRVVGKYYRDYLCDLKLGRALRLLIESDLSISEIAYASGFDNISTFNRAFRIKRGLSPREFRAQTRQPNAFSSAPPES